MSLGRRTATTTTRSPRRRRRLVTATALTIVLSVVGAAGRLPGLDAVANADPVGDMRAKAVRIAAQREQLTQEAERLNEQAKAAKDQLTKVDADLTATTAQLAAEQQRVDGLHAQATDLAVQTYIRGDITSSVGDLVSDSGATDLQLRQGYAPLALGQNSDVLDEARAATQDSERLTAKLASIKTDKTKLAATIATRQKAVERTQAQLVTLANQVDGDLARLVAEETARKEAEAEAAAAAKARAEEARLQAAQAAQAEQARQLVATQAQAAAKAQADQATRAAALRAAATTAATAGAAPASAPSAKGAPPTTSKTAGTKTPNTAPKSPRTTAPTAPAAGSGDAAPAPATAPTTPAPAPDVPDVSNYPAPSPAAAVAVAEALRQLGKPYVFGAAGPDTFDCSGLMMWAWAKAGVDMPHYTVSQYHSFPHVPISDVAPGDMIFFNVNLGHVGMYIGGGQYVQSPRTGDVVKVSNLAGRSVVGVVRPG